MSSSVCKGKKHIHIAACNHQRKRGEKKSLVRFFFSLLAFVRLCLTGGHSSSCKGEAVLLLLLTKEAKPRGLQASGGLIKM